MILQTLAHELNQKTTLHATPQTLNKYGHTTTNTTNPTKIHITKNGTTGHIILTLTNTTITLNTYTYTTDPHPTHKKQIDLNNPNALNQILKYIKTHLKRNPKHKK